jgi:uncharacterized protein (DUF58 family)
MRSAVGCIGLGALLLVVAGTFDAEPLYVTGCALVLLAAAAIGWIASGARGATVVRALGARTVVEEEPLEVRVAAHAGWLPLPPGWIDEPLLGKPVHLPAGKRVKSLRIEVTFARRGQRRLDPPRLVLRDPFGLAERVITGAATDEVTVLPRTYPVRATAGGGDAAVALRSRASLTAAAETEIDGLRPHREGAPASRIHWQSYARGHGLMERRLISEADSRPIVIVDLRGAARLEDTDAAVRAAASLTLHFSGQGGCALLLPGDRRAALIEPDRMAWPAAHVRLAVLGDAAGPALNAASNRRGLIVFVAARVLDRPPRALGRMPGGCLLVMPGRLPGRRAVVEVAGCHGYLAQRTGAAAALAAVGT